MRDPLATAQWDPMTLTYASDGEEVELPLRLLVLGRFATGGLGVSRPEPIDVTAATLNAVMRDLAPRLTLSVPDRLVPSGGMRDFELDFQSLDDFLPDRLIARVPELQAIAQFGERVRAGTVTAEEPLIGLLTELGWETSPQQDPVWREYAVAEIHTRLSSQLDEILHAGDFQTLEANWRGLTLIVEQLDPTGDTRLDILDLDKEALREDFAAHSSMEETLLFQSVYTREFGQYGGQPYAAVLGAFAFGAGAADVALLRRIGAIAAAAHAPFLADAAPELLGLKQFEELADATSLPDVHKAPRFAKWRSLLNDEVTRYLALTLPRLRLRRPYDQREGNVKRFAYRENIAQRSENCLWGSAIFGFAGCLVRSHLKHRVCVDIVGPEGGRVEGYSTAVEAGTYPVEVQLSEQREAELADLGLMPVTVARAHDYLSFNSAHTLHWGDIEARRRAATLGLKLGAQLPYVFLVSRIAHYLKSIERDMLGTVHTAAEMESELNTWLKRYVSDVENPAPEIRARRPLRQAALRVDSRDDGEAGRFSMHLSVTPHTKYLGRDFTLSLESRLGKAATPAENLEST